MVKQFFALSFFVFLLTGLASYFWPPAVFTLVLTLPIFIFGVLDVFQTRKAVKRNFPIIGKLRYFFEFIRPELQQYFVESNHDGRPVPREFRSVVYQRAKGELETLPFGTQRDVNAENHEWVHHSMDPKTLDVNDMRVTIGGPQCKHPYSASLFNISAMSYGALSKNAIIALNRGAKDGGFYHNTGEGGLSPYHKQGGDLVWQIGTGYFGCRDLEGHFSPEKFKETVVLPEVKMIEIKISQGAKPGKGGMLPGSKVSQEVADIRGVEVGKDVISPGKHSEFSSPQGLLLFIQKLRELSDYKPVGFKFCVGRRSEFYGICKAMVEMKIYPDFITVDGAEGGTGAAPLEFSNSVGRPLEDGLTFVVDTLKGFGLRDKIKVIASGKVFTSFHLLTKLALGADLVNSSRAMMMALGCIQALKCNSNACPVGVATTDPGLTRGLVPEDKARRVYNYHKKTIKAFADILGAMGCENPRQLKRTDVFRRVSNGVVKTYEDLFPTLEENILLGPGAHQSLSSELFVEFQHSTPHSFWMEEKASNEIIKKKTAG